MEEGELDGPTDSVIIEGACDLSPPHVMKGWLLERGDPAATVAFELLANGQVISIQVADQFRADLTGPEFGDGRHAFDFVIPFERIADGTGEVELAIRLSATEAILPGSRRVVDLRQVALSYAQLRTLPDALLEERLARRAERAQRTILAERGTLPDCTRVALYAVNARSPGAGHRKLLRELRELGYATVVVNSDDRFGFSWLPQAGPLADRVLIKRDEGRDFSSWLTGLHSVRNVLGHIDHILFVNESLVGPLRPLNTILDQAKQANVDFWALSDSYDCQYHLQSSFFILRHGALKSRCFREFVASYEYPNAKLDVISQGEIGLSACLLSGGLSYGVLCPYDELCMEWMANYQRHLDELANLVCFEDRSGRFVDERGLWLTGGYVEHWARWIHNIASSILSGEPRNAQHVFWRLMIERYGYPFIKRELLLSNPSGVPDLSLLSSTISREDWTMVLTDWRAAPGRAPPLGRSPFVHGHVATAAM